LFKPELKRFERIPAEPLFGFLDPRAYAAKKSFLTDGIKKHF